MNAVCVNTEASFDCLCLPGYEKNGDECDEIDECLNGLHKCDAHSDCQNTIGSFICQCHKGYRKVNDACVVDNGLHKSKFLVISLKQ